MRSRNHSAADDLPGKLHALHFASQSLDSLLQQITVLAADTVNADASAGVTVIHDGEPTTVAASDERTVHFDEIQYGHGEGPCLEAARTGEPVTVHDATNDVRWPQYHQRAAAQGLRSSLSVPLSLGDDAAGALNLYSFERHEFDADERAVITQFCDEASRAVSLAVRHAEVTRQNQDLHAAMATRRVIDQAVGVLMAQNRCGAQEAFDMLRRASQNRNVKINKLAAEMIHKVTGSEPDLDPHWHA